MRTAVATFLTAFFLVATVNTAFASGTEKKTPYATKNDGSTSERTVKKDSKQKTAKSGSTTEKDDEHAASEEIETSKKSGSTTEKKKKSYGSGTERD